MHNKLASFINQYLIIGCTVGHQTNYYRARLMEVTPEYFEMELYSPDGHFEGRYMGPTISITSVQADTRELQELSLYMQYNATPSDAIISLQ